MMLNNKGNKGVTLAELSVSISIISLLIAATFGGATMLKAAKIRKSVSEFSSYMAAINEFQNQYNYLPGDLPTASTYWPGAHNGNGNGVVDISGEDLYVWEHLGNMKLISGTYTGTVNGAYVIGTNSINSEPFSTGVFSFWTYNTASAGNADVVYSTSGNALRLGSLSSGMPTAGFIVAKDAYSIDKKLDDGVAASGMFYAARGGGGISNNCVTDTTNLYSLSDSTSTCTLYYWQKKF
jgi:prepilin-type N-terminal cleavage/methylation domain-containing protein